MILRLGFVDLVYHIASSILARLVALSELSELSGRAHPESSYIPLSQCKLQAVCCGDRLHVTVSGKVASLSLGRASNCTQILNFSKRFEIFLHGAILAFVKSHGISPMPYTSSIGFTEVKNAACLPLLRNFPPGTNPLLVLKFIAFAFPTFR